MQPTLSRMRILMRWPLNRPVLRQSSRLPVPMLQPRWKSQPMRFDCRRGMQRSVFFRAAKSAAWRSAVFCFRVPTCFCSMNRPTTLTRNLLIGSSSFCTAFRERWWRLPMIATSLTMLRNGFWSSTAGKASPGRAIIPRGLIRRKNVWKLKSVRKTLA